MHTCFLASVGVLLVLEDSDPVDSDPSTDPSKLSVLSGAAPGALPGSSLPGTQLSSPPPSLSPLAENRYPRRAEGITDAGDGGVVPAVPGQLA